MFRLIVVPVDGSARALRAVEFGAAIAAECDAALEVVQVVTEPAARGVALEELTAGIARLGELPMPARPVALVGNEVAPALADYVEGLPGSMIVMSSTGRGRTAAVLGSVADELLELTFGPLIVIGPHATGPRPLAGQLVVPVDGSAFADTAITLAGAWGVALGATPWIVEVLTLPPAVTSPDLTGSEFPIDPIGDVDPSADVARRARQLSAATGHQVEYEVLRGNSPGWAIVDFAKAIDAGSIVMSTHGRTGLRRLALGSVAADVVRHAPCPVVLQRPPRFPQVHDVPERETVANPA